MQTIIFNYVMLGKWKVNKPLITQQVVRYYTSTKL